MRISNVNTADSIKNAEVVNQPRFVENIDEAEGGISQENTDNVYEMTDENGKATRQAYQIAVNKMNEFMEYSHKNSKFVFHDGLEKYYVEIVDSKTDKVIKEIPPKKLLDAYYEMQKLVGKMFDTHA